MRRVLQLWRRLFLREFMGSFSTICCVCFGQGLCLHRLEVSSLGTVLSVTVGSGCFFHGQCRGIGPFQVSFLLITKSTVTPFNLRSTQFPRLPSAPDACRLSHGQKRFRETHSFSSPGRTQVPPIVSQIRWFILRSPAASRDL